MPVPMPIFEHIEHEQFLCAHIHRRQFETITLTIELVKMLHRAAPDRAVTVLEENIGCARSAIFVIRNHYRKHWST